MNFLVHSLDKNTSLQWQHDFKTLIVDMAPAQLNIFPLFFVFVFGFVFSRIVINEVMSGSIRTPLENVRNQTLANLLHSFEVQRLIMFLVCFVLKESFLRSQRLPKVE